MLKNKKFLTLVATTALAGSLSMPAKAADLNYNYVDLSYVSYDALGTPGAGFGVAGSFEVNPNINVVASYMAPDFSGTTISMIKLGAAYHAPIDDKMDWFAMMDYRSADAGGTGVSGYALSGGTRMAASDDLEMELSLGYANYDGFSGIIFGLGAVYKVSDQMGVSFGYESDTEAFGWSGFKIGARMNF